jgi:tyrosyl-tRNA synthetase
MKPDTIKQNLNTQTMTIDLEKDLFHKTGIEEIISVESLKKLLETVEKPNHYIGFEISGKIHLGTGIGTMKVVRKLQELGFTCKIFLADWHTWINDKLGGDREFIKRAAREFFIPMFDACADIAGADKSKIEYILGSDLYNNTEDYWATLINAAKKTTLSRMQRSVTIMGRKEGENMDFAKLIYPIMQVADIFALDAHVAHAGTDQRKAHVVALECADQITINPLQDDEGNVLKPVCIHHHLTMGLSTPSVWPLTDEMKKDPTISEELKMSKSKPGSAIFVTDSEDVIRASIKKAFCPPQEIDYNPVLDWIKSFVFDLLPDGETWTVERPEKWGGNVAYENIEDLKKDYKDDKIAGEDLKNNLAEWLVNLLEPTRKLTEDPNIKEILEKIESYSVKR